MPQDLHVAVFQLNSGPNIESNKQGVLDLLDAEGVLNADLWVFPECALFRHRQLEEFRAFNKDETIIPWFCELALKHEKWILVGSYFRAATGKDSDAKAFNTSVLIDPTGSPVADYDKIHLFDVKLPQTAFSESQLFAAGSSPVVANINGFKCGFSICFDLRFPELYRHYADKGCDLVFIPSSFTQQTGQRHWNALCLARAVENQCYVLAPNQVGIGSNNADTYGHSLIIDPYGRVLAEGPENKPAVLTATLSKTTLKTTRTHFPLLSARKL